MNFWGNPAEPGITTGIYGKTGRLYKILKVSAGGGGANLLTESKKKLTGAVRSVTLNETQPLCSLRLD